jgi:signal transduction histidine kinase
MRLPLWARKPPVSLPRWAALLISVALLALVGALDWLTGPNLDFSLFYLIPVAFVTWYAGQASGYSMSVLSAATWLCVDRLTGAKPLTPWIVYWNFFVRLGFFSASVWMLQGWRNFGTRLTTMVEQRTSELRKLAAKLSAAEDAERRKLAYDMHDALSQTLSSIKINVDTALLDSTDRAAARRQLTESSQMINDVINQTRTLMFDLYPAMLDDLGLVPTLQWYAKEFEQRTRIEIAVLEQGPQREIPRTLRNYLFRTAKELLSNSMRHGKASEITVLIHWEPRSIRLVVDDDGAGFDVELLHSPDARRGLGLPAIRERVNSMGGRLDIESQRGRGTRVIVEVPLSINHETDQQHAVTSAAG